MSAYGIEPIIERARAIRLSGKALAKLSGVDQTTVTRAIAGKRVPLSSTIEKMHTGLEIEELALLRYLTELHENKSVRQNDSPVESEIARAEGEGMPAQEAVS